MLSDEVIEKVVERLVNRIEEANLYTLKSIGATIKKIGTIKPSDVNQLVEAMQYGADYDKIVKKLAEITELNVQDIYEIFDEVAKTDTQFAEQFYKYRNKKFIPYAENINLQRQVRLFADMAVEAYRNLSNNTVIGFKTRDKDGKIIHRGLKETYQDVVDRAVIAISQGKSTYEGEVYKIMKELGKSGLTSVDYESGRSRRMDSAVRMNVKGALRDLHTRTQEELGKEFGADGWEISVHGQPAPDHAEAQGRQFSNDEFRKLQEDGIATTYDGIEIDMRRGKNHRPIGQLNCYHYPFSIVLGVNQPQYTDEQLKKIKEDNDEGFEFEGKHYTLYEGTQLQRQIETEIRRQKDLQILGRTGGSEQLANEAQRNINILTKKYQELSNVSGLPTKLERLKVDGYSQIKLVDDSEDKQEINGSKSILRKEKTEKSFDFNEQKEKLRQKGIIVNDDIQELDEDLVRRNLIYIEQLNDKYNVSDVQELLLEEGTGSNRSAIGTTFYANNRIRLNNQYFKEKKELIDVERYSQKTGWHNKIKEENLDIYTLTHEYGHAIENNYARKYIKRVHGIDTSKRRTSFTYKEKDLRQEIDKDIRNSMFRDIQNEEKISITEIKEKYFSGYGKSKRYYEWFAETFAQMELGEENPMTRAMKKWIEEVYNE